MIIYTASTNLHLFQILIISSNKYIKSILIISNKLKESKYLALLDKNILIIEEEFLLYNSFWTSILGRDKIIYKKYINFLKVAKEIYICNPLHSISNYLYNNSEAKYFMLDDGLSCLNIFPEKNNIKFKIKYFFKNIIRKIIYHVKNINILTASLYLDYYKTDNIKFISLVPYLHKNNTIPLSFYYNQKVENTFKELDFKYNKSVLFLSYYTDKKRINNLNNRFVLLGHPRIDYSFTDKEIIQGKLSELIIRYNNTYVESSSLILVFLFWKQVIDNNNKLYVLNLNSEIKNLIKNEKTIIECILKD